MKKSFTLAEVLITLAIIGVVAALTIPVVVQNYKRHEASTRLKKFYSNLENAVRLEQIRTATYPNTWWESSRQKNSSDPAGAFFDEYLARYFSYTKKGLVADIYEEEKNNWNFSMFPSIDWNRSGFAAVLSDGTILGLSGVGDILIDINGVKGPNKNGIDVFGFYWNDEPNSDNKGWNFKVASNRDELKTSCKNAQNNGNPCTYLLMLDGFEFKSDYPHGL